MTPTIDPPRIWAVGADERLGRSCVTFVMVACIAAITTARADDAVPQAFEACTACHAYQQDEPAQEAPTLWGIVGRRTASVEGFDYSPALKAYGGTWDRVRLDQFLKNPKAVVPGTYMKLGGVPSATERAVVLDFLERISPASAKSVGAVD